MSKKCDICGKTSMIGHNISHAHNLTRRRFYPNLQTVRAMNNGHLEKLTVCTQCIKSGRVVKAS